MKRKHIDEVQPPTVEEHLKLLMEDDSIIDTQMTDISPDNLPDWYDEKLFNEGQKFYQRNMLSIELASLCGLIAVLTIPTILRILIYTKQASTHCLAFKRYFQTKLHTSKVYNCKLNDWNSELYKSINVIRWKHKMSNKKSINANVGGIYQRDMALTQFGFMGYVLINPQLLGLRNNAEEDRAFVHLWRVIGHMIGIPDRLNLCRKTVEETRELCQRVNDNVFVTYMTNASSSFFYMARTIVDGLWHLDITLDADVILIYTYQLSGVKYKPEIGWTAWLKMKYFNTIIYLLLVSYIEVIVRNFYNYLFLILFPILNRCPLLAWVSFGKKNSQINLYPNYT